MNRLATSKEDILAASRELIKENGWAAVSIRSVAAKCSVSAGTIYNYYESKAELLGATIESVWQEIFFTHYLLFSYISHTACATGSPHQSTALSPLKCVQSPVLDPMYDMAETNLLILSVSLFYKLLLIEIHMCMKKIGKYILSSTFHFLCISQSHTVIPHTAAVYIL